MAFHKFIKIKGPDGSRTGYFVPHLYQLHWRIGLRIFGFQYVKDRLNGWSIWWVSNEENYVHVIETLEELKKTRIFDYMVSR